MKSTKSRLILCLVLVVITGAVVLTYAQAGDPVSRKARMEQRFTEADRDQSGTLSIEEFESMHRGPGHHFMSRSEIFSRIDTDGNHQLELAELQQAHQERRSRHEARLKEADQDHDGKLSRDEFLNGLTPRRAFDPADAFERLDVDGDHLLQADEIRPPAREHCVNSKPAPRHGPHFARHFTENDANGDGGLDLNEFSRAHARRHADRKTMIFEELDVNSDGYLDPDEMKTMPRGKRHRCVRDRANRDCVMREMRDSAKKAPASDAEDSGYDLGPAFPNPFNSTTAISYRIPEAQHVTLKIYNIAGQEVQTLVDDVQAADRYTVTFGPNDLTSGMYFYHLQAGEFSAIDRVLFIK